MITFRNPRLLAEFDDWPIGRNDRGRCVFKVESKESSARKIGQAGRNLWRVSRTTTNRLGAWCKPKCSTWSGQAAIVDGSDGRTYVLQIAQGYGFVKVMRHDFMDAEGGSVFAEVVNQAGQRVDNPRHPELVRLIFQAYDKDYCASLGIALDRKPEGGA